MEPEGSLPCVTGARHLTLHHYIETEAQIHRSRLSSPQCFVLFLTTLERAGISNQKMPVTELLQ
jgi:hypothetical protein